jgi:thioredoxin 1
MEALFNGYYLTILNLSTMITLTEMNFEAEVLNAQEPVLVLFKVTYSGVCSAFTPTVEELSKQAQYQSIKFCIADADDMPDIVEEYRITAIPMSVIFHKGEKYDWVVGKNEERLKELLNKTLKEL